MTRFIRIIRAMFIGLFLGLFIQTCLVAIGQVSGHSMMPTLKDQEYVLLSKVSHVLHMAPDYGDIVVIDSRIDRKHTIMDEIKAPLVEIHRRITGQEKGLNIWIKRVIGKSGDVLEFKNGHVYRNGQMLNEPYISEEMKYTIPVPYTIPENTVFVMGDNRNHSVDSRYIGPVPIDHVLGIVIFKSE